MTVARCTNCNDDFETTKKAIKAREQAGEPAVCYTCKRKAGEEQIAKDRAERKAKLAKLSHFAEGQTRAEDLYAELRNEMLNRAADLQKEFRYAAERFARADADLGKRLAEWTDGDEFYPETTGNVATDLERKAAEVQTMMRTLNRLGFAITAPRLTPPKPANNRFADLLEAFKQTKRDLHRQAKHCGPEEICQIGSCVLARGTVNGAEKSLTENQ